MNSPAKPPTDAALNAGFMIKAAHVVAWRAHFVEATIDAGDCRNRFGLRCRKRASWVQAVETAVLASSNRPTRSISLTMVAAAALIFF